MDCGVVWYTKSMYYQWLGQLPFTLPTYSILTLQTSDKHVRLSMHRLVLAQMICKGKGVCGTKNQTMQVLSPISTYHEPAHRARPPEGSKAESSGCQRHPRSQA